jgi:hypothetical protein
MITDKELFNMELSKFLSKVIGIYFIIVSSAMLLNMPQFLASVTLLINDAPLLFVTGFFTLIVGLLMVVSHNIWQWNWRVSITIIAWIVLLKASIIMICPQFIETIALSFVQDMNAAYIAAGVDFVIGLLLSYFGFRR